jgi:hypothetical protein
LTKHLRVFDILLRNRTPDDVTHYLAQDTQRKLEELELDSQVKNAYKANKDIPNKEAPPLEHFQPLKKTGMKKTIATPEHNSSEPQQH